MPILKTMLFLCAAVREFDWRCRRAFPTHPQGEGLLIEEAGEIRGGGRIADPLGFAVRRSAESEDVADPEAAVGFRVDDHHPPLPRQFGGKVERRRAGPLQLRAAHQAVRAHVRRAERRQAHADDGRLVVDGVPLVGGALVIFSRRRRDVAADRLAHGAFARHAVQVVACRCRLRLCLRRQVRARRQSKQEHQHRPAQATACHRVGFPIGASSLAPSGVGGDGSVVKIRTEGSRYPSEAISSRANWKKPTIVRDLPGFADVDGLPCLTAALRRLPRHRAIGGKRCRCYFGHDRQ